MCARLNFFRLHPSRRSNDRVPLLVQAVLLAALAGITASAAAHSPHHVIDELELSPDYSKDSTLFVLVYKYLLRSDDGAGSWRQLTNGLDTPYILTDIVTSRRFASDKVVFVSTEGSGIYKSSDRGESWSQFNAGLKRRKIGKLLTAIGSEGQVVLAAGVSRGLFASPVDEPAWRRVMSDDVQITALARVQRDARAFIFAGDSNGGVWRSEEGLSGWTRIARLGGVGSITALARTADATGAILVGTESSGVLKLPWDGSVAEDLAGSWPRRTEDCRGRRLEEPVPDLHVRDIETSSDGKTVLVTTWHTAVWQSTDGGQSWELADDGLRCNAQADAPAFSVPHFRDLEIDSSGQGDWFLSSFEGLYRSQDKGKTWVQFETMPVSLIRGMAISQALSDGQHAVILTTYGGGAYIGLDNGQTWHVVNRGLVTTRLSDAAFAPGSSDGDFRLFALADERLLELQDLERGWVASSLVYRGWRRRVGAGLEKYLGFSARYGKDLFLDYSERHGVWPMQIEISPSFSRDGLMLLGFRRRGIWVSEDGGSTWDREWNGPRDYVTDMKISPGFDVDGTAFAGIRGAGVYTTRDGARSWDPANSGLDYLGDWRPVTSPNHNVDPPISRAITDIVLAVSPEFVRDSTVYAGSASGLFVSHDAASSWQELSVLEPGQYDSIIAVAVSPSFHSDRLLIASVKGQGLFASDDAGTSFRRIGESLLRNNAEIQYLQFSPTFQSDHTIYAASDWDLWKSSDRGDTWSRIQRPFRYEDWRGENPGPVWFEGEWKRESASRFSASVQTVTDRQGDRAVLNFFGGTVSWFGELGPSAGKARVIIDGVEVDVVDLYSNTPKPRSLIRTIDGLGDSPHRIVIEATGQKNSQSTGYRVTVDNIDVRRH